MANAKLLVFFITIIIFFSAIYFPHWKINFQADLKSVLDGLLYQERRYEVNKGSKVAVGFGSCWDIVTRGVEVMTVANVASPPYPEHYNTISTMDELARTFAYFFQNGAAAE